MKLKDFHQIISFNATPHELYEMLMDEGKHGDFTGSDAKISRKGGGTFSVWGGELSGTNIELIPDKKIVQSWRSSDWPKGHVSTITFRFTKTKDGSELEFTQIGIPEEFYEDIKQGWEDYYWEPMKKYLL